MLCERIEKCPFYHEKMPMDSGMGAIYRKKFCETDKTKCARYQVASTVGPEKVPVNLYPNMFDQAQLIISDCRG